MDNYVWLFPLIFIFHDMEEIVGFGLWLEKNRKILSERYPFILKTYRNFSTAGFAFAVYEELAICLAICIGAVLTDSLILWGIWLGGLVGCALHFVVHIGQSVVMRQYIPSVATSILCIPVSVWLIIRSIPKILDKIRDNTSYIYNILHIPFVMRISADMDKEILGEVLLVGLIVVGVVIVVVNVKLAQKLIGWFTLRTGIEKS